MNQFNSSAGYPIYYQRSEPSATNGKILLICGAMGVPVRFYSDFSDYFTEQGYTVYRFDYRGMGAANAMLKDPSINMQSWAEDIAEMLDFIRAEQPAASIYALGHSAGGQLFGQVRNNELVSKLVIVASQSGDWRNWRGFDKLKVWLFWHLLIPVFANINPYFPSRRLGLFENIPKNVARQWATWGRSKGYFSAHLPSMGGYHRLQIPLLSMSFSDDFFAPPAAAEWLNAQYKNCQLQHLPYTPEQFGLKKIGHFDMFKSKFKAYFWQPIADFLRD